MSKKKVIVSEVYEDRYKDGCYADVYYFINSEKKVVVCKLVPHTDGYDYSRKLNYKQSIVRTFFELCYEDDISFVGKATCMDNDEFNIEFGKRLAYDKAMLNLFDAKRKFFMRNIKNFESHITANKELIDDVGKQIDKTIKRFDKKLAETADWPIGFSPVHRKKWRR